MSLCRRDFFRQGMNMTEYFLAPKRRRNRFEASVNICRVFNGLRALIRLPCRRDYGKIYVI